MISFLLSILIALPVLAAPIFSKKTLLLGGKQISVEIADTDEKREYGLMNREKMPADQGMLFIFKSEEILSFWMKNTLIPLNIGYFDKNRVLVSKTEMIPASPMDLYPKTYPSEKPAMYALEMNTGWFDKNKIKLGDRFEFVDSKPSKGPGTNTGKGPDAKTRTKTRAHAKP